jgi:hypothetical protein
MGAVLMATEDTVESQAGSVVRSIGSGVPLPDQFFARALRHLGRHRFEPPKWPKGR